MNKDSAKLVEVTQADREAAQALCASGWTHAIEAFARHRIAATRHTPTDGLAGELERLIDGLAAIPLADKGFIYESSDLLRGRPTTFRAHGANADFFYWLISNADAVHNAILTALSSRTYADGVEDAAKVAEGWHIPSDWTTDAWGGAASTKKAVASRIRALKDKSV